ncbi:MAG: hypothetical protein K2Y28_16270 [Burkholderiaceae bacterium]|nr:hypothetical protein [Burkholderiaceae bacterium]
MQISYFRENHIVRGGNVLTGAGKLPEEGDNEILGIFVKMFLGIIGGVSLGPKKK